jgi:hypothetical protein
MEFGSFPKDFMLDLAAEEVDLLVLQNVIPSRGKRCEPLTADKLNGERPHFPAPAPHGIAVTHHLQMNQEGAYHVKK